MTIIIFKSSGFRLFKCDWGHSVCWNFSYTRLWACIYYANMQAYGLSYCRIGLMQSVPCLRFSSICIFAGGVWLVKDCRWYLMKKTSVRNNLARGSIAVLSPLIRALHSTLCRRGGPAPPSNAWFIRPTSVSPLKQLLDRFSRFCTAHPCSQYTQTDGHTDHGTCDICSNRPHLCTRRHTMRPN